MNVTVFGTQKDEKKISKEISSDRVKVWNPASSEFTGPWGKYKVDGF
jgi:hypothetical protein